MKKNKIIYYISTIIGAGIYVMMLSYAIYCLLYTVKFQLNPYLVLILLIVWILSGILSIKYEIKVKTEKLKESGL